jgi:hypothetical protein
VALFDAGQDGVIEKMFIEPQKPGDPFEVSDADTMLAYLQSEGEEARPGRDLHPRGLQLLHEGEGAARKLGVRLRRESARSPHPHEGDRRSHRQGHGAAGLHQRRYIGGWDDWRCGSASEESGV